MNLTDQFFAGRGTRQSTRIPNFTLRIDHAVL